MAKYGHDKRDFQLGDYWLAQRGESPAWYRCWYDEKSRRTKRASLGTTDFEEAKQILTDWFIANQNPQKQKADALVLAEIFARFYEQHAKHLRSHTQARIAFNHWLDFYKDATLTEAAQIERQEQFHAWLKDEKGLAHNSVHRIVAVGKTAINWAWKRGECDHMPYIIPITFKNAPPKGRPLEMKEMARLFENANSKHLQIFIALMLGTAARPDAIFDLTFDRCDFKNRLIILNPVGREQTNKYRPTVKMPQSLEPLLQRLQSRAHNHDSVIYFRGRQITAIKKSWNKARDTAGLDNKVQPYSLRHTMARWLRTQGVPAWEVAAQLGHKQQGFSTTEIYAPFSPDYLQKSVQAIDLFFDELRANCAPVDDFLKP